MDVEKLDESVPMEIEYDNEVNTEEDIDMEVMKEQTKIQSNQSDDSQATSIEMEIDISQWISCGQETVIETVSDIEIVLKISIKMKQNSIHLSN